MLLFYFLPFSLPQSLRMFSFRFNRWYFSSCRSFCVPFLRILLSTLPPDLFNYRCYLNRRQNMQNNAVMRLCYALKFDKSFLVDKKKMLGRTHQRATITPKIDRKLIHDFCCIIISSSCSFCRTSYTLCHFWQTSALNECHSKHFHISMEMFLFCSIFHATQSKWYFCWEKNYVIVFRETWISSHMKIHISIESLLSFFK